MFKSVTMGLGICFLVGCGTSSKKLMTLAPLPTNAPVQIFHSEPNVKYDKVCEIEAVGNNTFGGYSSGRDFDEMLKTEARKCGADGVIYYSLSGYERGKVTALATGIKIKSQVGGLMDQDKIKAYSLAIQTHDVGKVREVLADVPKNPADRAPTDDEVINLGLYIATLDGIACDAKIVTLLEDEYQGRVTKFQAVNLFRPGKGDANTPECRDVMARALPKMSDRSSAIVTVNNHYVSLLNSGDDKNFDRKVSSFNKILIEASRLIIEACKKSSTDSVCAMKAGYLDFANKTKMAKSAALKENAQEVLTILQTGKN